MSLVTALGFYSMFDSLQSLWNLQQKHDFVTVISVEGFSRVLHAEHQHIRKWREAIEVQMNIRLDKMKHIAVRL